MHLAAFSAWVLIISLLETVSGLRTIVGQYGETIEVPCYKEIKTEDIKMTKWKFTNASGSSGDLLKKAGSPNVTFIPNSEYDGRINLTKDLSLQITKVKLADQKLFTCMVVTDQDLVEYPVQVTVQKAPSAPVITNQAKVLEIGKLTLLAECSTKDANPAANITWFKDNVTLESDGTVVKITTNEQTDKETSLLSTSSKLEYAAVKGDMNAKFTCAVQHKSLASDLVSAPMTFVIHYPAEHVSLQVMPTGPIKEGDNVTLKCKADGNPPPSSFNFYIKGKKEKVESDTYTLPKVTRSNSGEYKCSLVDNDAMAASVDITVMYLDFANVTTGKVVKRLSESFEPTLELSASGKVQVSWSKNKTKLTSQPKFDKLKYSDSGVYKYEATMDGLVKSASFELAVQGAPVITKLTKQRSDNGKVLICEAEGLPKPAVQWSINGTNASEIEFTEGKIIYKLNIIPTVNLTVDCTVFNDLGQDVMSIDVSTISDDVTMDKREQAEESGNSTQVAVGVVLGLLLAALLVGLAYWIYMKRTREGSWRTEEKENGTLEESKKLEETQSQKADV
ncbi:activated leukocyte cell adhesion molecule b [Trichomycterus rosablanca]|uniref:activated leukocyte cell adhesion molecule b n=1 Tax=Trichomycterus rosablanca TaxID=2290929 RepID=UPI002F35549A